MQQAIPYKSWQPFDPLSHSSVSTSSKRAVRGPSINTTDVVSSMVSENAVIVFAKRGCCMSHVVKRLLLGLGTNPCVYEVDEGDDEASVLDALEMIVNNNNNNGSHDDRDRQKVQFPAVFIGGKLFGGLDRIMATHITGELIPVLKEAKALWL